MKKRKKQSAISILIINVLFYMITPLIISLLFTALACLYKNPLDLTGILGLLSLLISGAVCGFVNVKTNKDKGIKMPLISSLIATLVLFVASLFVCGTEGILRTLMNCACYILSCLLFATLAKRERRHKRKRRV